jgi:peptidoglycan/xylan/chitin deacetylase (PgdA/CDA1 family)
MGSGWSGLARSAREAWEVPRDLMLGRYPAFVTGGGLERGEIPVFVFHSAEPESFARKLEHLARNGYVTLSLDDYIAALRGRRAPPERAVLLTFDDGRGTVWSVAAPLLKRHGMRAVVFLVPGRVPSREPGPDLDDAAAGRAPASAATDRERGEAALLSWQEIEALAKTGLFEFQSHTLLHARVHTSPRLAGFVTPATRSGYAAFDQPLVREGARDRIGDEVPLGTPLLRSAPRTSDEPRFFEDEAFRHACVAAVAAGGGAAFFERPGWDAELRSLSGALPARGRVETKPEQEAAIRRELAEARTLIEERTGRPAVHLCYPWHVAGETARRLAAEAGYETAFCGKVEGVPITRPGGDLRRIARLGEDYVELLPGSGRGSLSALLARKWRRRFRSARA